MTDHSLHFSNSLFDNASSCTLPRHPTIYVTHPSLGNVRSRPENRSYHDSVPSQAQSFKYKFRPASLRCQCHIINHRGIALSFRPNCVALHLHILGSQGELHRPVSFNGRFMSNIPRRLASQSYALVSTVALTSISATKCKIEQTNGNHKFWPERKHSQNGDLSEQRLSAV